MLTITSNGNCRELTRFLLSELTLLGCGWWQYQDRPNAYTSYLYNRILSKSMMHSVRDGYTKKQLKACGVEKRSEYVLPHDVVAHAAPSGAHRERDEGNRSLYVYRLRQEPFRRQRDNIRTHQAISSCILLASGSGRLCIRKKLEPRQYSVYCPHA